MAKDQASEQMDATAMMAEIGAKAKAAAKELAYATAERKHAALKYAKEKSPNAGQILRLQSKLQQVQLALKLATGDNNMTLRHTLSKYTCLFSS